MKIDVANLTGAGKTFEHQYQPGELTLEDERVRLIDPHPEVAGTVKRDSQRIKVTGQLSAHLEVECDRCLKPIDSEVQTAFSREYETSRDYEATHAVELSADDLDVSIYDGAVIDIDALVREEILLAAPEQVFCKPDCAGLCPKCGADLNAGKCECDLTETDPRWAGLKELVNGES